MVSFFFLYRIWHIHNLALAAVVLLAHKNQLQLEETQVDSPLNQYQSIVNPNKEKMVRLSEVLCGNTLLVWLLIMKRRPNAIIVRSFFVGKSSYGMSHLKQHFYRCPRRKADGGDIRQMILKTDSKGNVNSSALNEKQGIEKLAKMIILHDYPLSMVEHRGFRDFTTTIQPLSSVLAVIL